MRTKDYLWTMFWADAIHKMSAKATSVSGLWNDDHHHASNNSEMHNGWFIQNQMEISGVNHNTHIPQLETYGNDGTRYYGPFEEQHMGINSGSINYLQRKFICVVPTKSVVLKYYTAGCVTQIHAEDMTEISLNDDDIVYQASIGYNNTGFDPYSGHEEDGYLLDDESLQSQCHEDNSYWIQKHGHTWTNIAKIGQNTEFQINIRVDADNDDLVMLYGITLECVANKGEQKSTSNIGVIVGVVLSVIIVVAGMTFSSYKFMEMRLLSEATYAMEIESKPDQQNRGSPVRVTDSEYDISHIGVEVIESSIIGYKSDEP